MKNLYLGPLYCSGVSRKVLKEDKYELSKDGYNADGSENLDIAWVRILHNADHAFYGSAAIPTLVLLEESQGTKGHYHKSY